MLSYFIAVLIIYCIQSVEYLLHMQCYEVAKLQHLIVAEYYTYQQATNQKYDRRGSGSPSGYGA